MTAVESCAASNAINLGKLCEQIHIKFYAMVVWWMVPLPKPEASSGI